MTEADARSSTTSPAPERRWRALAVCLVAMFATLLDVSVTNVALPSIGRATGAGPSELQWVVSGYILAFGLVPVIAGRLGDDRGRRTMFVIGVAGFTLTSLVVGLSPNPTWLVTARFVQGLFGGLINPQVSGLVQQMFTGRDRARAFGAIGTVVGVSTAVGPVAGGALIGIGGPEFGWRLVFFVNVPIGIAAVVLGLRWLPGPAAPGDTTTPAGPARRAPARPGHRVRAGSAGGIRQHPRRSAVPVGAARGAVGRWRSGVANVG